MTYLKKGFIIFNAFKYYLKYFTIKIKKLILIIFNKVNKVLSNIYGLFLNKQSFNILLENL